MNEEKGPHCSLAHTMLDRYLPDAVSLHKSSQPPYPFNGEPIKYAPPSYWDEVKIKLNDRIEEK